MSTEKTPVLLRDKTPYGEGNFDEKRKSCTANLITSIFVTILLSLLIILIVQFFYWPVDKRVEVWDEHVTKPSQRYKDATSTKKYEVPSPAPWDFEFLIDPADLCVTYNPPNSAQYAEDPEVKLLMLVPSAVDHFEQRIAIRNTWGSVAEKPFGPMRLGFILGTTANPTLTDQIREESSQYRDIIQADFVDNYYGRTTKSILMLKWVARRCPHAQYFLKAEDDTFVNLEKIARTLSNEPYISQEKFISGYIQKDGAPMRTSTKTFYLSLDDYLQDEYPPYVSGSAYVMTIPTAIELFDASKEVLPFLPEEDIFLTGLCAQHTDVPLIHESSFSINPPSPPSWEAFSPLSTAHSVSPAGLEQVWDEMTKSVLNSLFNIHSAMNSTVIRRLKRNL